MATSVSPFGGGAAAPPSFNFTALPQGLGPNFSSIQSLLSQQPQSVTNTIMPYLQSLYGSQANMMQPIFAQQTAQGVASAQSGAMQRGLTGSNIESAGMQGAQTAGNQSYNQYLASLQGQLGQAYTGAATADIGAQNSWINNLSQALGQQMQSQTQQSQFTDYMNTLLQQAQITGNAEIQAGQSGMWGSLGGGALGMIGSLGSAAIKAGG